MKKRPGMAHFWKREKFKPWWWSSGQSARLLLRQSEFESRWLLQFYSVKFVFEEIENKQKEAGVGPFCPMHLSLIFVLGICLVKVDATKKPLIYPMVLTIYWQSSVSRKEAFIAMESSKYIYHSKQEKDKRDWFEKMEKMWKTFLQNWSIRFTRLIDFWTL